MELLTVIQLLSISYWTLSRGMAPKPCTPTMSTNISNVTTGRGANGAPLSQRHTSGDLELTALNGVGLTCRVPH